MNETFELPEERVSVKTKLNFSLGGLANGLLNGLAPFLREPPPIINGKVYAQTPDIGRILLGDSKFRRPPPDEHYIVTVFPQHMHRLNQNRTDGLDRFLNIIPSDHH